MLSYLSLSDAGKLGGFAERLGLGRIFGSKSTTVTNTAGIARTAVKGTGLALGAAGLITVIDGISK